MIDNVNGVDMVKFPVHGDDRGSLIAIETCREFGFEMRRVYYIYDTKSGVVRGKHAHRDMNQILISVSGSCDVLVFDGKNETTVTLSNPGDGLYITGFIWREMKNFSDDCVLLVLTDKLYEETEYVFDKEKVEEKQEDIST